MSICLWPATLRPREKLLSQGPAALSDAELLALFLRTGVRGKSAVELAQQALQRFAGINGLLSASLDEFSTLPGLGVVKYTQLQAVREVCKRLLGEQLRAGLPLDGSSRLHDFLVLQLGNRDREVFFALFLDVRLHLIATEELFRGSLTDTSIYPREVVRAALGHNAGAVIFAHNHPSGLAKPSQADCKVTEQLRTALAMVDIQTVDHCIVAGNQVFSFRDHGML